MPPGAKIGSVAEVRDRGSLLVTAADPHGLTEEILVVPCEDGGTPVTAWINQCTHEDQALDTGEGAAIRDGQMICPRHGSLFDTCSGECSNGPAADTTLPSVDLTVEDGEVYLSDRAYTFRHAGPSEDDDGPSSTSHIGF